ncbi:hypothetical protein CkaCkLH20_09086 [Colletotrichum karsti]|uniref:Uncharacterized protein n=1 Tax=Colletotrichum karsti TaxID=1095194 RepID=A0A9P6HYN4_9PEZI|nr:uncharacterized protein CkaCkLH20_09086 [Colletotrichum karsti]KAF9873273.1 hypothetical protein CkaCkLH20_09086 [Colletotrichum karsti]
MYLFKTLAITATLVPAISAQIFGTFPTSTDADEYLSRLRLSTTVSGSQATSLASALFSVESKFYNDEKVTTVFSNMFSAAAQATNSPEVVASLAVSRLTWGVVVDEKWWDDKMPENDDKFVSEYLSDYSEAYAGVMATATETGSKGAAPRCTGMAMAGVAAGVAAGVMVAL